MKRLPTVSPACGWHVSSGRARCCLACPSALSLVGSLHSFRSSRPRLSSSTARRESRRRAFPGAGARRSDVWTGCTSSSRPRRGTGKRAATRSRSRRPQERRPARARCPSSHVARRPRFVAKAHPSRSANRGCALPTRPARLLEHRASGGARECHHHHRERWNRAVEEGAFPRLPGHVTQRAGVRADVPAGERHAALVVDRE